MPSLRPVDLFTDVLQTLGVQGAAQAAPNAEDAAMLLRIWNRVAGQWNTRRRFGAFVQEQSFTFTLSQLTYAIGAAANTPVPDFVVSYGNAPQSLISAWVVLTDSTPNVRLQLAIINQDQWQVVTIPSLSATFPDTVYYIRPGGQTLNGTIRPWPAFPTNTSYQLDLAWWVQVVPLLAADMTTPVILPDGADEALMLTIAEKAWLRFPKRTDQVELLRQARMARADYCSNNVPPPLIETTGGANMGKRASGWNWKTYGQG